MQNMTVELHDSSSGGGRSKASDSHEYTCTQVEGALVEGALLSERVFKCACHPSVFFEPKPRHASTYKLYGGDYTAIRKIKEDLRSSTWLCISEVRPNE
jgi:hypothetical protein